jgi:hypothetical protein
MAGGGWWFFNHFRLSPFTVPAATAAPGSTPRPATATTGNAGGANACTARVDAAAAATAAAAPRTAYTPLPDSWVAFSPALRIRFYGMPWWDDRPAASHSTRYQVGVPSDTPDTDQLDVLRVPGTGAAATSAAWQTELDTFTHRSTAGISGGINSASISNVLVTERPHLQKAAGYDGYLGQFHFTEDASRGMDATLWVGQVGCDRVVLLFTGPPTRDQQIAQAVTQVLSTIDFSAR